MKRIIHWAWLAAVPFVLAGCAQKPENPPAVQQEPSKMDTEVQQALSKLAPETRRRADTQKDCPVSGKPLGSMGTPVEVKVNDQPVFICCEHCRKSVLKDPEKTLGKVKGLKEKTE